MSPPTLKVVALEFTRLCNMRCPHCYTDAGRAISDELSTGEWFSLLDQIAEYEPKILGWSGGEPLLRADFLEVFSYAYKKHGLRATLVSNGLTLTPENIEVLKGNGLINIQISLDGSTHEINSRIRGGTKAMFDRIIQSLKCCREAGVETLLGVMPHPVNIDDLENIAKLADDYGVSYIRFCAFVSYGRGQSPEIKGKYMLSHRQYRAFLSTAAAIERPNVILDAVHGPMPPDYNFACRTRDGCPAGTDMIYICANGEVYPCTALWAPEFKAGSIRERTLKEIYNDEQMRTVGRFSKDNIKGQCRACDNFSNCGGACRGTVYSMTGDLSASLPYCFYREEHKPNNY